MQSERGLKVGRQELLAQVHTSPLSQDTLVLTGHLHAFAVLMDTEGCLTRLPVPWTGSECPQAGPPSLKAITDHPGELCFKEKESGAQGVRGLSRVGHATQGRANLECSWLNPPII